MTHGTHSGYVQHRARGEEACDSCKAAHSRYYKQWRNKRIMGKGKIEPADDPQASWRKAVASLHLV